MNASFSGPAPGWLARAAGGLYLLVFGLGAVAFQRVPLIVRGDAAATAANILGAEGLYRASVMAGVLASVCYAGLAVALYELLRPARRRAALLGALLALGGSVVGAGASFLLLAPLVILGGGTNLAAFGPEQLNALALLFARLYAQAESAGFVFFACSCVVLGYAAARAAFLPRALGVLMAVAGVAWLANTVGGLLGTAPLPFVPAPVAAAVGQVPFALWLLVRGVDDRRWREQAASVVR